jgi:acyl dehydratase
MPLNLEQLQSAQLDKPMQWSERDSIIYALACGYGREGVNSTNLRYLYERELEVVSGFASVLARNAAPSVAKFGGEYSKSVLASERCEFFNSLPANGSVNTLTTVSAVIDKGAEKGALVALETILEDSQKKYARVTACIMARADGGCGSFGTIEKNPTKPDGPADASVTIPTRVDHAALYRLLGDTNPLHIDAAAAKAAGFRTPILHGLCTYGIAACEIERSLSGPIIGSLDARFSAPVYPGETLRLDLWKGATAHFELHAIERNIRVLSSGIATTQSH